MNIARILIGVAVIAFGAGFWTACSVGFDINDNKFSCTADDDCITNHECVGGVCIQRGVEPPCTDLDGDGYGVGETGDCPLCVERGLCEEDCNDNDASMNPGLLDTCDGKDNNCDGEIDEPIPCESSLDCPDEQPYLQSCEGGICVYKPPNQFGGPGCNDPVQCVDGERVPPGDDCF